MHLFLACKSRCKSHEMGHIIGLFKLNCRTKKTPACGSQQQLGSESLLLQPCFLLARYLKQAILRCPSPPPYLLLMQLTNVKFIPTHTLLPRSHLKGNVQPATTKDGVSFRWAQPPKPKTTPEMEKTWVCRLVCHDLTFYTFERWKVHWTGMNWNGLVKESHGFMDSGFLSKGAVQGKSI